MDTNEILLTLGQNIKKNRYEKNFSQERLAELSELDRTYISSVECGKRNISALNIIKIALALNVKIDSLFINIETVHD